MRSFADLQRQLWPVPIGAARHLSAIDQGAGREELYRRQLPAVLDSLAARARIESVRASSAIEDIVVDRLQVDRLLRGGQPRSRPQAEIAGYRDALDHLFGDGLDEPFTLPLVLRLHRLLFGRTDDLGGRTKEEDNRVVDRWPDGRVTDRFKTVAKRDTEFFLRELHDRFDAALDADEHHPVLLAGAYAFDLLVIHPFENGNGRVARLATTALLQRAGFGVVRYVAIEGLIDRTSDDYYRSLAESTVGWHEGNHDLWPWLSYLTGRVAAAYAELEQRTSGGDDRPTKQDRVGAYVLRLGPARFSRDDIRDALPDISDATITRVLQRLRKDGSIEPLGLGPTAQWQRRAGA